MGSQGNGSADSADPFAGRTFQTLLFDLDDTLYPLSSGLAAACRTNIQSYMVERLGIPEGSVDELCSELYSQYGTTMAGLQAVGHHLDYDDWHDYVHGRLPYSTALRPDPALRRLLQSLPQAKWVFTNADTKHAARVLAILGLADCFRGVICFESIQAAPPPPASGAPSPTASGAATPPLPEDSPCCPSAPDSPCTSAAPSPHPPRSLRRESSLETIKVALRLARAGRKGAEASLAGLQAALEGGPPRIVCKPQAEAYARALRIAGAEARSSLFLDDSLRNIGAAKAAGLATVLVGQRARCEGADLALLSVHELPSAVPSLWLPGGPAAGSPGSDLLEERRPQLLPSVPA